MFERTTVVLLCTLASACGSHTAGEPVPKKQHGASHDMPEIPPPTAAADTEMAATATSASAEAGADGNAGKQSESAGADAMPAPPASAAALAGSGGSAGASGSASNVAGAGGAAGAKPSSSGPVLVAGEVTAAPVPCTSDSECMESDDPDTLWRPICDRASSSCGPCATQAQENAMAARVIECLTLMPLQACAGDCLVRSCHRPCAED